MVGRELKVKKAQDSLDHEERQQDTSQEKCGVGRRFLQQPEPSHVVVPGGVLSGWRHPPKTNRQSTTVDLD
jgi:hypothetical protein